MYTNSFICPVTLIVLLIHWAAYNTPRYPSQNGTVPCTSRSASGFRPRLTNPFHYVVISDLGAQELKPLFVVGCVIAGSTLLATLIIIHRRRTMLDYTLPPTSDNIEAPNEPKDGKVDCTRLSARAHTVSSWVALVFTSIALISLILLAGFDCLRYPKIHSLFLMCFGVPLFVGSLGSVALLGIQSVTYPQFPWLQRALWMKAITGSIFLVITLAFVVRMGTAERPYDYQFDQAGESCAPLFSPSCSSYVSSAILEWIMALTAAIYTLTYWYDLRHLLHLQPPQTDRSTDA